ncbi:MAG: potassium-transporting ATPase subunit KdpA, partial [Candidatus Omnitrophica bacterium]|nr:potassium-transporting ATPase subunit KdpA [Candidatus Omnitrophota bacterium]
MNLNNLVQSLIFLTALLLLVKPLGIYMARIYEGKPAGINVWFGWLERLVYRLSGVHPEQGMSWKTYAIAMMLFNMLGIAVVYILQRVQAHLFLNPMSMPAVNPDLAFNTAVSFATNTNWQSYGGETTLSYLTQMLGLTVQNFVSAATGMAILVAVIRGFIQKQVETIGNFWVDLVRSTLYILLPLALILSFVLVSQGVVQTFNPSVKTVSGQVIALG